MVLPWLHTWVVHIALVLGVTGLLVDMVGIWRGSEPLQRAGRINLTLAALGAVGALLTGLVARDHAGPRGPVASSLLQLHETVSASGALGLCVVALLRLVMGPTVRTGLRTLYMAAALLVLVVVGAGSGLGGALVYRYGVGLPVEAARAVLLAHDQASSTEIETETATATATGRSMGTESQVTPRPRASRPSR